MVQASAWALDSVELTLDEAKSHLLGQGFKPSIVNRAAKRLDSITSRPDGVHLVEGNPLMGDEYPSYAVCLEADQRYSCSCWGHNYGETRQHRLCSHIVAVMMARHMDMELRVVYTPTPEPPQTMTPGSLHLPPKFQSWNQYQLETVEKIVGSDKKLILLQAPTGSGKTLTMAAVQKLSRQQMLYTAHTKQLQEQVHDDFPYSVVLKGRGNYPCLKHPNMFPFLTAAECTKTPGQRNCAKCHYHSDACEKSIEEDLNCPCVLDCSYLRQKRAAVAAELCVVNTPLFLSEANYAGQFSNWPWLVLDEGDLTEQALMGFVQIEFSQRVMEKLGIPPPEKVTVLESWVDWAGNTALPLVKDRVKTLSPSDMAVLKERNYLGRLTDKLSYFHAQVNEGWVFVPSEKTWTFKPIYVAKAAEKYLWAHTNKVLVMSATIIDKYQFCRDLGYNPSDVEWIDVPSTFPKENRPIYYWPAANMTHKTEAVAWPLAVKAIDDVIRRHPNDKGLVHAVSYRFAEHIMKNSQFQDRLVTHANSGERVKVLDEFRASLNPLVLVSSSMDRGIDLPDDLCRFVVVPKVPFPNLGDKQVSSRLYSDKAHGNQWYIVQTIRSVIQMTGRGVRSLSDTCDCYISDEQFGRIWREHRKYFPRWWAEAVKEVKEVSVRSSR